MKICFIVLFVLLSKPIVTIAQNQLLQSGPMIGHVDFKEAILWVQTKKAAKVQFIYWDKENPHKVDSTLQIKTEKESGYTAKLLADKVIPAKVYNYQVLINDKRVKLSYPTFFKTPELFDEEELPNLKIALGSCVSVYDSLYDPRTEGYTGEYPIFESILSKTPDMMFWLGDNIYLREQDWNTQTGINYRYTHTRSVSEMQPLLAVVQNYAIWDDHDFGPNDSDRSFIHKDKTLEAFKNFWGNPSFGLSNQKGITTMFTYGDIDFFLLDNRYYRSPQKRKTGNSTVLGKNQLEWLIDALAFSEATFKVVALGNLLLSTSAHYKNQNYISNFNEERTYLLKRIEEEDLKNILFITGDKHFTELSTLNNAKGNTLYEFTVSPLTSKANTRKDPNAYRVEGTLVQEQNFGIIEFTGKSKSRKVIFKTFDKMGNKLWEKEILEEK